MKDKEFVLHAEDHPDVYYNISRQSISMPLIVGAGYRISRTAFWHEPRACPGNLLVYFLEGTASTALVESDEILTTTGGTFYSLPPKTTHCPGTENFEPHTAIWFQFAPATKAAIKNTAFTLSEYQVLFQTLVTSGPGVYTMTRHLRDALRDCMSLVAQQEQSPIALFAPAMRTRICDVLLETCACMCITELSAHTNFSQAIQSYIASHYGEPIQIRDMAKHMGYDETWFKKRFKREIGFTPNHYLQHKRINVAKDLLCNTNQSIIDIAFQTGFNSSQYFSHVFKKVTGITPRYYRDKDRGDTKDK